MKKKITFKNNNEHSCWCNYKGNQKKIKEVQVLLKKQRGSEIFLKLFFSCNSNLRIWKWNICCNESVEREGEFSRHPSYLLLFSEFWELKKIIYGKKNIKGGLISAIDLYNRSMTVGVNIYMKCRILLWCWLYISSIYNKSSQQIIH